MLLNLKKVCVAAVFILAFVGGVNAGVIEDGVAAIQRGDYATAYRHWMSLAEQGNAKAQYILGAMYGNGDGVPQNHAEAVRWYRKAAKQGIAEAQYTLGSIYFEGHGVPQDHAEAVRWFRKAAEQGIAEAQFNLGLMYYEGKLVLQGYIEAHKWFNLAAAAGYADAVKGRDLVAEKMNPTQISEAQRLAREWRPKKEK